MFTDQPVTPLRLETLVATVMELGSSGTLSREALLELLQPETLPDFNREAGEPRSAAKQALKAALDLGLVIEEEGTLRVSESGRAKPRRATRELVLAALDERVLATCDVETYFAPFYSFMLAFDSSMPSLPGPQEWADKYNAVVFGGALPPNPLNKDKVRGLLRWYPYAGLGWSDPDGAFHCDPTERVERAIPRIFRDESELEGDTFMASLAEACPELDGGEQFQTGNPAHVERGRTITPGLAHALIGLHLDGSLKLHCPADSPGWDLSSASPPNDGKTLRSNRLDKVERPIGGKRTGNRGGAA